MKALPTILTAAIVSFGVATVASPAAKAPPTHDIGTAALSDTRTAAAPSLADKLAALTLRVDRLQNRESIDRENIYSLAGATQSALDVTNCIDGSLLVGFDNDGGLISAGADDPDAALVATIAAKCAS